MRNTISRRYLHKNDTFQGKPEKFNLTQCNFQINNLKYNGETDSYLFVRDNYFYSVELSAADY